MDDQLRAIVAAERAVLLADSAGVLPRWRSGRALLAMRAGRRRLPRGRVGEILRAVRRRTGADLCPQELQRRMRAAEAYPTERHLREALREHRTWTGLRDAGFPEVSVPLTLVPPVEPECPPLPGLSLDALYMTYGSVPARRVTIAEARTRHLRDSARATAALAALDRLAGAVDGDESRLIGDAVDVLAARSLVSLAA